MSWSDDGVTKKRGPWESVSLLGIVSLSSVSLRSVSLEGDVVAVVAPLGGVAQVVSHGVKVVGVGVGVHGEEGKEKDEEVRVEVKGEVEENQRQPHMCMA